MTRVIIEHGNIKYQIFQAEKNDKKVIDWTNGDMTKFAYQLLVGENMSFKGAAVYFNEMVAGKGLGVLASIGTFSGYAHKNGGLQKMRNQISNAEKEIETESIMLSSAQKESSDLGKIIRSLMTKEVRGYKPKTTADLGEIVFNFLDPSERRGMSQDFIGIQIDKICDGNMLDSDINMNVLGACVAISEREPGGLIKRVRKLGLEPVRY